MRKVIVAFEVPNFSEGAMRFADQMNDVERIIITGIFLPKPVFTAFQTADVMTPGIFSMRCRKSGTRFSDGAKTRSTRRYRRLARLCM